MVQALIAVDSARVRQAAVSCSTSVLGGDALQGVLAKRQAQRRVGRAGQFQHRLG